MQPFSAVIDTTTEVFRADCESRPILDQIANKWSMMCMAVLDEPRRFNEIKRRLQGVTQRVLTQTLRKLERDGLIERRVLPTSPVGVEYAITPSANRCVNRSAGSTTGPCRMRNRSVEARSVTTPG